MILIVIVIQFSDNRFLSSNQTFTYCSDDGSRRSWIDHFVCSSVVDNRVQDTTGMYDVIGSDHKPMSIIMTLNVSSTYYQCRSNNSVIRCKYVCWNEASDSHICMYQETFDNILREIDILSDPLSLPDTCCNCCNELDHNTDIEIL